MPTTEDSLSRFLEQYSELFEDFSLPTSAHEPDQSWKLSYSVYPLYARGLHKFIMTHQGREALLVADSYGYRIVDTRTGAVTSPYEIVEPGFPGAASDVAINDEFIALTDLVTRPRVFLVDRADYKIVATWPNIDAPCGVVLRDSGDPIVADFTTGTLIGLSRKDRSLRDILVDGLDGEKTVSSRSTRPRTAPRRLPWRSACRP